MRLYLLAFTLVFALNQLSFAANDFPLEVKKALLSIDNSKLFSPGEKNEIMADYASTHVPSDDKTFYEVLFWNTSTGKSCLYYYSYSDKGFKAYDEQTQFPSTPLSFSPKGKVMADYTAVHVEEEDKTYYEALFWDTKTGQSTLYYYSYSDKKFKSYEESVQLPASPLNGDQSEVMADYTAVYVPTQEKTYYEVLFWDTKTGNSKLYYYSYSDKSFIAYEDNVQFPSSPLGNEPAGDIMADYTSIYVSSEDKTYYEALFWDTRTGQSRLYYYNYNDKKFKAYDDDTQLPKVPMDFSVSSNIMADYTAVYVPSSNKTFYEVLFWDTKNGNSKLYHYSYSDKRFKAYQDNVQLPESPISADGAIMADYTSIHVPSQDKTYYEVLFWDKKTGKSVLYYYDYTSKNFKAYKDSVQLPESPIK